MSILGFFEWLNNDILAIPATIIFFGVAVVLTFKTRFMQFRGFGHFIKVLKRACTKHAYGNDNEKTISPLHALFTAMGTTIGMGNVVGPSVAIFVGGPGALFWLLIYIFFGAATKFAEATFAVETRITKPDGRVIGGPMQYLALLSPWLSKWYILVMSFLLIEWSMVQANTLGAVSELHGLLPAWSVGLILSGIILIIMKGGVERVGDMASKLVPLMFTLYFVFSLYILLSDPLSMWHAILGIKHSIFTGSAAMGGFAGASIFMAMRIGFYRGIFITEAGTGTSAIPHAVADVEHPVDQGILALYSMASDAFLSTLSGLMILVTGVWTVGDFRSTLIYEAFEARAPGIGSWVLLLTISLFVFTTVMGNTFNGTQSFGSLFKRSFVRVYLATAIVMIFLGTMLPVGLVWGIMDVLLALVAIPNLIGVAILSFKYPKVLELPQK